MEQKVSGPKLKSWQGLLLILLAAVFLLAAQFVLSFLQYALAYFRILPAQTAYTIVSVGYWLLGGVIALKFLRDYVLNYVYTANTKQLRVERVYGDGRPRFVEDVYFSRLQAFGAAEEIRARYPAAKTVRAVKRREPLPVRALAYGVSDGVRVLLFQPSEALCARVEDALRQNRK